MPSLKYSIVILLFLALLTQSFSRSLVVAEYLFNFEVYNKACINKAKPNLHCNGKCQMLKNMKKHENDNETNVPISKFNQPELVLSSKSYFPNLEHILYLNKPDFYRFNSPLSFNDYPAVFHPPTDCITI